LPPPIPHRAVLGHLGLRLAGDPLRLSGPARCGLRSRSDRRRPGSGFLYLSGIGIHWAESRSISLAVSIGAHGARGFGSVGVSGAESGGQLEGRAVCSSLIRATYVHKEAMRTLARKVAIARGARTNVALLRCWGCIPHGLAGISLSRPRPPDGRLRFMPRVACDRRPAAVEVDDRPARTRTTTARRWASVLLGILVVISLGAGVLHSTGLLVYWVRLTSMDFHVGAAIAACRWCVHVVARRIRVRPTTSRGARCFAPGRSSQRGRGLCRNRAAGRQPECQARRADSPARNEAARSCRDRMPVSSWMLDAIPHIEAMSWQLSAGGPPVVVWRALCLR